MEGIKGLIPLSGPDFIIIILFAKTYVMNKNINQYVEQDKLGSSGTLTAA